MQINAKSLITLAGRVVLAIIFIMKNPPIAGGLLVLAAHGPDRIGIDGRRALRLAQDSAL